MTSNRFAHCVTADRVLHSYAAMPDPEPDWCTDALARIAELSRPVVDEAARLRARFIVAEAMDSPRNSWHVTDDIIDALGYTTPASDDALAESKPHESPAPAVEPSTSNESQRTSKFDVPVVDLDARVSAEELIAVLGAHVYGDRGPFTDHPHRFSVCTRAAEDLVTRYRVLRIGGGE